MVIRYNTSSNSGGSAGNQKVAGSDPRSVEVSPERDGEWASRDREGDVKKNKSPDGNTEGISSRSLTFHQTGTRETYL